MVKILGNSRFVSLAALSVALAVPHAAMAAAPVLPEYGKVKSGSVTVNSLDSTMTVRQTSAVAEVNWSSFSIGKGGSVNVIQPDAASLLINRVTGAEPSSINGNLKANGNLFLINKNGIAIGPSGVVSARNFIASTLGLSTSRGKGWEYLFSSESPSAITVDGSINGVGAQGNVVLLGGVVKIGKTGSVNASVIQINAAKQTAVDTNYWVFYPKFVETPGAKIEIDGQITSSCSTQCQNSGGFSFFDLNAGTLADAVINISGTVSLGYNAASSINVGSDNYGRQLTFNNNSGNTSGGPFKFINDGTDPDASLTINRSVYNVAFTKSDLAKSIINSENVVLANDLDLNNMPLLSGTTSNYIGYFNGLGHKISNARVVSTDDRSNVGILPTLSGDAYVGNLTLENVYVEGKGSEKKIHYVGGLTGQVLSPAVLINNVYLSGTVKGLGSDSIGGMVGMNYGTISNSYAFVNIQPTSVETLNESSANNNRGGLVGFAISGSTIVNSGSGGLITSSYNPDDDSFMAGLTQSGGLVGGGEGTIENSSSSAMVVDGFIAGGLAGNFSGTIKNSYSTGTVRGIKFTNVNLGGLVGICDLCTITNSHSTSSIFSLDNSNSYSGVGGLVGSMTTSTIDNSFYNGSILLSAGRGGGLVGSTTWDVNEPSVTPKITRSYAKGSITGGDFTIVGGLVGQMADGSQLIGNISNMSVSSGLNSVAGGLVGWNFGTVSNSYSTGSVKGEEAWTGALLGRQGTTGTLRNSVYLTSLKLPGVGVDKGDVKDVKGLTSDQLKDGSSAKRYLGGDYFTYPKGKTPVLR